LFPIASKTVQVSSPAVWNSDTCFFSLLSIPRWAPSSRTPAATSTSCKKAGANPEPTNYLQPRMETNAGEQASKQMKEIGRAVYFAANHI
jgi:hypothetical protein